MIDLTPAERQFSATRKIIDHANDRLNSMRQQNDGPYLDERETAMIRGRIAELKDLLRQLILPASDEPGE